eukprot:CAMPEP_0194044718 /NCGR_PEP_ID=MMETSP0009_2-20130614/16140_1 /TAXON_ID=210454 /ORGANISM="Grammatophora oceanica, Strain CCMP 410" /LENGTH=31 /DNA_ID= /DNA_START= /DNA_END= /DNA_ORIENTATION=
MDKSHDDALKKERGMRRPSKTASLDVCAHSV